MSTYLIVDISGKVLDYDYALTSAMQAISGERIVLATHVPDKTKYSGEKLRLVNLVPPSYKTSGGRLKRLAKAIEGFLNYIILLIYIMRKSPAVVHFQWFPYLEFSSIEIPIIKLLRKIKPNSKIVYTIHNVFPHSTNQDTNRSIYRNRFLRVKPLIDHFIVHTEQSANDVENTFGIEKTMLSVVPHGIFKPDYHLKKNRSNYSEKKTIIFYGANRRNKGADILLDAIHLLPNEYKNYVRVLMVGRTPAEYLAELKNKCSGIDVTLDPRFIPDKELYEMIDESDYIALPYREITQSGVLLLALYFQKPLLISDLPPFLETLKGFSNDMFFEAGNSNSMSELIVRHLTGKIDVEKELKIIRNLNSDYSWENSAKRTLNIYKEINILG